MASATTVADSDLGSPLSEPSRQQASQSAQPADLKKIEASTRRNLKAAAQSFGPTTGPHRLEGFFRALQRLEDPTASERVHVLQLGDSHTAGDALTGQLRRRFQDDFGDGGRGYVHPGAPWRGYSQEAMSWDTSSGWRAHLATRNDDRGPWGIAGVRMDTYGPGTWVKRGTCEYCDGGEAFDAYSVHFLRQPGGGRFAIRIDGRTVQTVSTAGARGLGVVHGRVPEGPHTLRVRTVSNGPVGLFGISTRRGREGVVYSNLGLNGATAGDLGEALGPMARAELRRLSPELLVFALGTNGAYSLYRFARRYADNPRAIEQQRRRWAEEYRDALSNIMNVAGSASCLVLTPPDLSVGEGPAGRPVALNFVIDTQHRIADDLGCAVWNQSTAMGGPGSIERWAQKRPKWAQRDGKHLTVRGYRAVADRLYGDVMDAYQRWQAGMSRGLPTRRIASHP
jgi:lysophospholipase L1-like esterase